MNENEKILFDKFLEYRDQWLKLFMTDVDSVRINKNSETGKLEVWEWFKKERIEKLSTSSLMLDKKI